ncbi:MAG: hypothetical protein VKM01_08010 [Cyanobacteriota bacterium]|nr:hypothetical protein [Cyanobacteriota bacterium]
MTNRARLLLVTPVLLGGTLATMLLAALVNPAWQRLQAREAELADLQERQQLLPLLREQLLRELEARQRAQGRRDLLLAMVEGSGDAGTLMAAVGRLAQARGIRVTLYEPRGDTAAPASAAPATPPPAAAAGRPEAPAVRSDGLAVEGLRRQELLLSARGPFPGLLAFLRDLERLQVLVVQGNLELALERTDAAKGDIRNPVTLKLTLGLYSRPAPASDRQPSRPRAAKPPAQPE